MTSLPDQEVAPCPLCERTELVKRLEWPQAPKHPLLPMRGMWTRLVAWPGDATAPWDPSLYHLPGRRRGCLRADY